VNLNLTSIRCCVVSGDHAFADFSRGFSLRNWVEKMLPKDQKVALLAMRMLHVARDKTSAFGEAESRDEMLESIPILLNILESVQHLLMSHTAGGVVNLQNMYSKFSRGPPDIKSDDGSTVVDSEFKTRLKVISTSFSVEMSFDLLTMIFPDL
jgi:hypothetical protein